MSVDNLPANLEDLSERDIMILTGQKQDGPVLPSLRINYNDADDDGNELPRGYWTIFTEEGRAVYAKEVLFTPMFLTHQYSHYSKELKKQISISVHFLKWSDEIVDSAGGYRCGKVNKKEREKLSKDEQKLQDEIKLARVVFGLVTMEGKTREGIATKVENMPCVFYARGTNYMPIDKFFAELGKKNIMMQKSVVKLGLKLERNEGVTYWEVVPEVVGNREFGKKELDTLKVFSEIVRDENNVIVEKFSKVKSKGTRKVDEVLSERYKGNIIEGKGTLADDMSDDLPDILAAG